MTAMKAMLGKYHYSAFGGAPLLGSTACASSATAPRRTGPSPTRIGVAAQEVRTHVNEPSSPELEALPR